jgi:hypothetical protein
MAWLCSFSLTRVRNSSREYPRLSGSEKREITGIGFLVINAREFCRCEAHGRVIAARSVHFEVVRLIAEKTLLRAQANRAIVIVDFFRSDFVSAGFDDRNDDLETPARLQIDIATVGKGALGPLWRGLVAPCETQNHHSDKNGNAFDVHTGRT